MQATKTRMTTGTKPARQSGDSDRTSQSRGRQTVCASHAPRKPAGHGESNVVLGAHPSAEHSQEASYDAADNLF